MTEPDLAAAVRLAVEAWMLVTPPDQWLVELNSPLDLGAKLTLAVERELMNLGFALGPARRVVLSSPYFHMKQAFAPSDLPNTPQSFVPVPFAAGCIAGQAAALAVHGFLRNETVSYGSENGGALFVNLVAFPGEGKLADKSKDKMRGHTDAVSFPFNGDFDADNPRIAPSPDLVTLVGLRNPNSVPTTVMMLRDVLELLAPSDIAELQKNQYSIEAQTTFILGMKEILGEVHTVIDEPVLKVTSNGLLVRYSHRAVSPTDPGGAAEAASNALEAACSTVATYVVVDAGDLLVVSNRLCLHGRGVVGEGVGGDSRWLLRTYGLDTSNLNPSRRHLGARPSFVLYP